MNIKNTILLSLAALSITPKATHTAATSHAPDTPAYNQAREMLYAQGYPQKRVEQEVAEMREHFLSEGLNEKQIQHLVHAGAAIETTRKRLIIACNNNPKIQETIAEWVAFFYKDQQADDITTESIAFKAILPPYLYHELKLEKHIPKADHKEDIQYAQRIQAKLQSYPEIIAYINAVDELFDITMQLAQNSTDVTVTQQQIAEDIEMFAQIYILEFMEQLAEDLKYMVQAERLAKGLQYIPELEVIDA